MKSIELLNIDINTLAPISEWILLESELNFARKHFPSIGVIGSTLFVTGGAFSSKNASHSVEKFENFADGQYGRVCLFQERYVHGQNSQIWVHRHVGFVFHLLCD